MFPEFLFIRHAESLHNQRTYQLSQKLGPGSKIKQSKQYQQIKFCEQLIDGGLSVKGQEQIKLAKKSIKFDKIDTVIVSPLSRALVTCDAIFGEQKHINIYVQPLMSQALTSAIDIGGKLKQARQKYQGRFNFDRIPPGSQQRWFLDFILSQQKRKQVLLISQNNHLTINQSALQLLRNGGGQTTKQLQERVKLFKQQLLRYSKLSKHRLVLVGHSSFFKFLTATGFHYDGTPINGIDFQNCKPKQVPIIIDGYYFEDQDLNAVCKLPF